MLDCFSIPTNPNLKPFFFKFKAHHQIIPKTNIFCRKTPYVVQPFLFFLIILVKRSNRYQMQSSGSAYDLFVPAYNFLNSLGGLSTDTKAVN